MMHCTQHRELGRYKPHGTAHVARALVMAGLVLFAAGCETFSPGRVYGVLAGIWTPLLPFTVVETLIEDRTGPVLAEYTPDGGALLVGYNDSVRQRLHWVALADGSAEAVTTGNRIDLGPVFAPDGAWFVFPSNPPGERARVNLFVADAEGAAIQRVTSGEQYDLLPQVSPDGAWIAYSSTRGGRRPAYINVIRADGSQKQTLDDGEYFDVNPVFLPDGDTVLFMRGTWYGNLSPMAPAQWHHFDLYTWRPGEPEASKLTQTRWYNFRSFTLAPDGEHVLLDTGAGFTDNCYLVPIDAPDETQMVVLDFDTMTVSVVPSDILDAPALRQPRYTPDGQFLVCAAAPGEFAESANLYALDLDNGAARQLTAFESGEIVQHAVSPDGAQIAFLRDPDPDRLRGSYELWTVNLDGTDLRELEIQP